MRKSLLARSSASCVSQILYRPRVHIRNYPSTPHLRLQPHFKTSLALCQHSLHFASTSQGITAESRSLATRIKNLLFGTSIALTLWFGYLYVTDVRAGIHQWAVVPSLRWVYDDAEEAHEAGTEWLRGLHAWGLHPRERGARDQKGDLSVDVWHTLFHGGSFDGRKS